jgi:hypothetical protein
MAEDDQETTPNREDDPATASRPASARQVAANRRNALRSTGPRTDAGKQAVRLNPLKHGLTARDAVIPALDGPNAARDFGRLRTALRRYYDSADPLSASDIDELVVLHWWRRRALRSLRSRVLKRLTAAERARADQASQRRGDVTLLALADKNALATTPDTLESLLAILAEIRLGIETLGCLSEQSRAMLVNHFPARPGGFLELCLTYAALGALGPDLALQPEHPGDLPNAEQCTRAILALLRGEQDRLHGLKDALEAEAARHRELEDLLTLGPTQEDAAILEFYARFQRQADRLRDRLDHQRLQRRGGPVPPTLNLRVQGPD